MVRIEEFRPNPIYDVALKASPVTPWTPAPEPTDWNLDVWQEPKSSARTLAAVLRNGGEPR